MGVFVCLRLCVFMSVHYKYVCVLSLMRKSGVCWDVHVHAGCRRNQQ